MTCLRLDLLAMVCGPETVQRRWMCSGAASECRAESAAFVSVSFLG